MQEHTIDYFQDWRYVWNGYWCIVITILTVGYGDYFLQTLTGRIIVVFSCLWGTILISLMVISMTISIDFNSQELMAYDLLKKREMDRKLQEKWLELIIYSLILKRYPDSRESITINSSEPNI